MLAFWVVQIRRNAHWDHKLLKILAVRGVGHGRSEICVSWEPITQVTKKSPSIWAGTSVWIDSEMGVGGQNVCLNLLWRKTCWGEAILYPFVTGRARLRGANCRWAPGCRIGASVQNKLQKIPVVLQNGQLSAEDRSALVGAAMLALWNQAHGQ